MEPREGRTCVDSGTVFLILVFPSLLVLRDISERGRDLEQILSQYITFVKPAFEEFCLPVSCVPVFFSLNLDFTILSIQIKVYKWSCPAGISLPPRSDCSSVLTSQERAALGVLPVCSPGALTYHSFSRGSPSGSCCLIPTSCTRLAWWAHGVRPFMEGVSYLRTDSAIWIFRRSAVRVAVQGVCSYRVFLLNPFCHHLCTLFRACHWPPWRSPYGRCAVLEHRLPFLCPSLGPPRGNRGAL